MQSDAKEKIYADDNFGYFRYQLRSKRKLMGERKDKKYKYRQKQNSLFSYVTRKKNIIKWNIEKE